VLERRGMFKKPSIAGRLGEPPQLATSYGS
jgi:hypothetical protein